MHNLAVGDMVNDIIINPRFNLCASVSSLSACLHACLLLHHLRENLESCNLQTQLRGGTGSQSVCASLVYCTWYW